MRRLCNVINKFDTVEEYWDESFLNRALVNALEADEEIIERFETEFKSFVRADSLSLFVPSGRDALRLALSQVKSASGRYVLVPNFTCPVVGDAILEAGFQICVFDFAPMADWSHWEKLIPKIRSGEVGAIIIPHLFGLPCDLSSLVEITRKYHIPLIEDCAHCLGGKVAGKSVGTVGDFAIFSFNYDKPISLGGGGMLICNPSPFFSESVLKTLKDEVRRECLPIETEKRKLFEFIAWLCNRREQIGARNTNSVLDSIKLKVGKILSKIIQNKQKSSTPIKLPWLAGVGVLRAALGILLMKEYQTVASIRNRNYQVFENLVMKHQVGELLDSHSPGVEPAWIKAKLIIPHKTTGQIDNLGQHMRLLGFRVGRLNWPYTLLQKFPHANSLDVFAKNKASVRMAKFSLDIPIHQNMEISDINNMANGIIEWLK